MFAVAPTRRIQIDVDGPNDARLSIIRDLALSNGRWLMVHPCPTVDGLRAFQRQRRLGLVQVGLARELVAALPDSRRVALVALLREGKRSGAIGQLRAATGWDLTAVRVIDVLGGVIR